MSVLLGGAWGAFAAHGDDGEEQPSGSTTELSCREPTRVASDAGTYSETQGSLGAPTFSDPRQLCGAGPKVHPMSDVHVVCKLYAPSIPSVVPDGYWYLLADGPAAGRFAAANTFMNGDELGEGSITNTDLAVPDC